MIPYLLFLSSFACVSGSIFCIFMFPGKLMGQKHAFRTKIVFVIGICFLLILGMLHITHIIHSVYNNLPIKSIRAVNLFCLTLLPILLNLFISVLTGRDLKDKNFLIKNYIFPISLILTIGLGIALAFQNADYQPTMEKAYPENSIIWFRKPGHVDLYMSLFIILFYQYLSVRSIAVFRNNRTDRSILSKTSPSQSVLNIVFLLTAMNILYFLLSLISINIPILYNAGIFSFNIISFILLTTFSYNLFTCNYLTSSVPHKAEAKKKINNSEVISKEKFERYLQEHKPFLNCELKLSDVTQYMGTNRTYLSLFINENYGMSFSHFINSLRIEELKQLKLSPHYKGTPEEELIYIVGFKSYKSYQKTIENVSNNLPLS